jgi:hypothetical protein
MKKFSGILFILGFALIVKAEISPQEVLHILENARSGELYYSPEYKCLTPYILTILEHRSKLPLEMRAQLQKLFKRPTEEGSWWNVGALPRKFKTEHFLIHYTLLGEHRVQSPDTTPANGIPDAVEVAASAFEKAWLVFLTELEMKELKLRKPIEDEDKRWDVYIFKLRGGVLGFAAPEFYSLIAPTGGRCSAYFALSSELYSLFGDTEGKGRLETVVAHEFMHGIQMGYNVVMPRWWMEGCATWAEAAVYDGSERGETDGNKFFEAQLSSWFRHPDYSLQLVNGWHEYGNVIWVKYLVQKFGPGIIASVYEAFIEGSYTEMINFRLPFLERGEFLSNVFLEFTLWNYFTGVERSRLKTSREIPYYTDEGIWKKKPEFHYLRAEEYPPVSIFLEDRHSHYPVKRSYGKGRVPESFGARYVEFLPPKEKTDFELSIHLNGQDLTSREALALCYERGLKGWGGVIIKHLEGEKVEIERIRIFPSHQEGQINIKSFGGRVKKVALIIANLDPYISRAKTRPEISYAAAERPKTVFSSFSAQSDSQGRVNLSWILENREAFSKIYIFRKRYTRLLEDTDIQPLNEEECYGPARSMFGLPEGNIDLIGETRSNNFQDTTTFLDLPLPKEEPFPGDVFYSYGVVPVTPEGVWSSAAFSEFLLVKDTEPPTVDIRVKPKGVRRYILEIRCSEFIRDVTLGIPPEVKVEIKEREFKNWKVELIFPSNTPRGKKEIKVTVRDRVGQKVEEKIAFSYPHPYPLEEPRLVVYPVPFSLRYSQEKKLIFQTGRKMRSFKVKLYTLTGFLVRVLDKEGSEVNPRLGEAYWDGRNEKGKIVKSGFYLYLVKGEGYQKRGKILFIK